jgi:DNA-binding transcriptional LysR family regulator
MTLRRIDLNLLVIFEAILSERSITRAAKKVGLSQSAMSHALRRLRQTFNDDLVRRKSNVMVPTQRALQLAEPVRNALQQIKHVVDDQLNFVGKTSKRVFNIQVSEFLVAWVLPVLYARVRLEAPHIRLAVGYPSTAGGMDWDVQLSVSGNVDTMRGCRRERLFQEPYLTVLRRDHPAAGREMTLELLMELQHLEISSASIGSTRLDHTLAQLDRPRRTVLKLPNMSGVLPIVRQSDLCVIVPRPWLNMHGPLTEFATSPLPVPDIEFTVDLFIHESRERDPGLRWLCGLIREEFGALRQGLQYLDSQKSLSQAAPHEALATSLENSALPR